MKENDTEKSELSRLKRENARLKKENEYLNHRLEKLSPKEVKNMPHDRELFLSSGDVDKYKGYFGYLFAHLKVSWVYRIYDRVFFALRKVILASKIWKYIPIVLGVFGVIFQFLLTLGSVVVLLPFIIVLSAFFLAFSIISFARKRLELLRVAAGRRVYFLYPAVRPRKDGFFYETMQSFARDGIVFTVTSSYTLCGFGAARKVSEGVYFIHTSFYYTFIKKAEKSGREIVKVY